MKTKKKAVKKTHAKAKKPKGKPVRTKVDICIPYRDKEYIEGETEDGVLFNIEEGLKAEGWKTVPDLDDAVDYQTNSTAIQFTLVTPAKVTKKKILESLGIADLSVNIGEEA